MSTPYERVCEEQKALSENIEKLNGFINSDKYKDVSYMQRHLLGIQLEAMKTYNSCLTSRISEFQGVPIEA